MSNSIALDRTAEITSFLRTIGHSYNGKRLEMVLTNAVSIGNTAWDGGSRASYLLVEMLPVLRVTSVQNEITPFSNGKYMTIDLPENSLVIKHKIFSGKDMGLTIYCNPASIPPALATTSNVELTERERLVLNAAGAYKSNYRFDECQRKDETLTKSQYEATKVALIAKGLLAKNGSITTAGKNAR